MVAMTLLFRYNQGESEEAARNVGFVTFTCVWIPWLFKTFREEDHRRLGGLTVLGVYVLSVMAWLRPNESPILSSRVRYTSQVITSMLHLEVLVRTPSLMLMNHVLLHLMAAVTLGPGESIALFPLASAAMFVLFCWRRWPQKDSPVTPVSLDQLIELTQLVLESGDELCDSTRQQLQQVATTLSSLPSSDLEKNVSLKQFVEPPECSTGGSSSALGIGTGSVSYTHLTLPTKRIV
eukprot:TRINITY_DN21534_c0_g1_i2.p1 TRINITY_DN21534_c0_g1~~TRINITY_DN21534_c0_g1_i2.p1  ORF type:complete len:236 (+),score=36.65 TRINITY_DN21534_c0_g1_i2:340-1047(+)